MEVGYEGLFAEKLAVGVGKDLEPPGLPNQAEVFRDRKELPFQVLE